MIWSVSTALRRSGAAVPVWVVKASISVRLQRSSSQVGRGGQLPGQGGRGGDGRRHQVGAPALALPALEVAVAGGGRPLPRLQLVGVHAQAHRAARAAPLGAGVEEHPVEALGLGLRLDAHRPGDDEHPGVGVDVLAAQQLGGHPQVLDPAVGAGAEEDRVDRDVAQRRAGGQAHVGQRLLDGATLALVGDVGRVGHGAGDRQPLAGVGAPGDVRASASRRRGAPRGRTRRPRRCAASTSTRRRRPSRRPAGRAGGPAGSRRSSASGAIRPAFAPASIDMLQIVIRASIDSSSIALPRYSMTWPWAPSVPICGDDGEDDVLRRDAGRQLAVDGDRHLLRAVLRQRLRGQHVLDLAGADAERQRAEGAVGRGVAVAADDRHARLGQPQLRADDVHDALVAVAHRGQPDAELGGVLAQRLDLRAAHRVGDRGEDVQRRDVVVLGRHREVGTADRPAGRPEAVERLRAGHLVHEVQIDVEQVGLARRRCAPRGRRRPSPPGSSARLVLSLASH